MRRNDVLDASRSHCNSARRSSEDCSSTASPRLRFDAIVINGIQFDYTLRMSLDDWLTNEADACLGSHRLEVNEPRLEHCPNG